MIQSPGFTFRSSKEMLLALGKANSIAMSDIMTSDITVIELKFHIYLYLELSSRINIL